MRGLGTSPIGTASVGLAVPERAPERTAVTSLGYPVSPRLDPATRAIVLDRFGTPELADGTEQRVLIALSMDLGSSAVRTLGNTLSSIKTIGDNFDKRIDLTVREALDSMVVSREIRILSVEPQRVGQTGIFARVTWAKLGEDGERVAFAGTRMAALASGEAFAPRVFGASDVVTTGGPTLVHGEGFTPDAVVYTTNVARATSFLEPSLLLATLPAHASGFVSLFVRQASGTSLPAQVEYVTAGVAPLPVATSTTSVTDAGGTTTVTGSDFTADAVVWTDGAARVTTFVNATTLTAVVPAHTAGTVNLYVAQASGNSGTISLAYTASFVDPATLNLTGHWDANDYSGSGAPILGRASAGASGNKRLFVDPTDASGLPSSALLSGKKVVQHAGNSPLAAATDAAPAVRLSQGVFLPDATYAWSIVAALPVGANTGSPTYLNPCLLSTRYDGAAVAYYGSTLMATSQPGASAGEFDGSYKSTPVVPTASGVLTLFQAHMASGVLRFRVGKGTWQTVNVVANGHAILPMWIAGKSGGAAMFAGAWSEIITSDGLTTGQLDELADRAAAVWGVTL